METELRFFLLLQSKAAFYRRISMISSLVFMHLFACMKAFAVNGRNV